MAPTLDRQVADHLDAIRPQLDALASSRPLALLCHSPAASLAARHDDGTWPVAGYRMTGLSNAEERLNTFGWKAPWCLEGLPPVQASFEVLRRPGPCLGR